MRTLYVEQMVSFPYSTPLFFIVFYHLLFLLFLPITCFLIRDSRSINKRSHPLRVGAGVGST